MLTWLSHPVVLVSLGGALGANARYWLSWWMRHQAWAAGFPWATLLTNIVGSILLGIILVVTLENLHQQHRSMYLLLGTGFCGAFTTFSTFEYETLELIHRGFWGRALAYVGVSFLAGLAGVAIAVFVTRRLI